MNNQPKTSFRLPIFLMIAPTLLIIVAIVLYAAAGFLIDNFPQGNNPSSSNPGSGLSGGLGAVQDRATTESLFGDNGEGGTVRSVVNIALFLVGAVGVLGMLPCFIIGLVLLIKRAENRRIQKAGVQPQATPISSDLTKPFDQ